ncbi:MAG TPA: NifU family protein [Flavobacteriales bacterium]|jgi:Fe-S cluster biogenesis protein NfuA|nr:NifU family protein [Flavobacteriales bacterium]HRQ84069.1 NifU family protein [Flavobacteriales bacterium]
MMSATSTVEKRQLAGVRERVLQALAEIRPFLQADGGDISLEEVGSDGTVRVKLHGACSTCTMVAMTMKAGVEEAIKRAAPEVVKVEAVV